MDNLTVANRTIGIDIGSHSVKVVSMQQRLGATSIEKTAEVPIRRDEDGTISPDAVVKALSRAMDGIRVRKDIVVVGISTNTAAARSLTIPFSDIGKARAVIKFQAEPHIPFPIDDVIIDFYDMKTGSEERMDVLLTAIRKQVVQQQLDIVRKIGIDPEVLEVDFMAVCNTVNKSGETAEDGILLMDIGCSKTIVAFVKDGIPLALRSFPIGGDTITNAIAGKSGVSFDEAERLKIEKANALAGPDDPENGPLNETVKSVLERFSGEVNRTLRFLTAQLAGHGQYRVVLTGGGAALNGMAEFVHEILGHEIVILKKLSNIKNNTGSAIPTALFAVAIGLCLRGVGETAFLQNFRREELAYSQTYKRMRTSIYMSVILLAAIFVVYLAGIIAKIHVLNRQSTRLGSMIKQEVSSTLGKVSDHKSAVDLVENVRMAVINKREELKDLRGTQLISVLDIIRELSAVIPKEMEIQLRRFDISDTVKGAVLVIEGSAKTTDDIVQIEDFMKESEVFSDVKSEGGKQERDRYRFKFKVEIK